MDSPRDPGAGFARGAVQGWHCLRILNAQRYTERSHSSSAPHATNPWHNIWHAFIPSQAEGLVPEGNVTLMQYHPPFTYGWQVGAGRRAARGLRINACMCPAAVVPERGAIALFPTTTPFSDFKLPTTPARERGAVQRQGVTRVTSDAVTELRRQAPSAAAKQQWASPPTDQPAMRVPPNAPHFGVT